MNAQRPSSIADQLRRCERYAEDHQLEVVATYSDEAMKGWNRARKNYQAMLASAARREFDVLIVDDLSRPFRDSAEQKIVLRRLEILGIRVISVADGWDSHAPGAKLTADVKGLMNEQLSEAISGLTRRGQEGRILSGCSAGGSVYGYRTESITDGGRVTGYRRTIMNTEAEIIRSIYSDYAAGLSPAQIAERLNARGVRGPRGDHWSRNAIYGDRRDLSGILNNPLYTGESVWNRATFLRDLDTGGRVKRRNPESKWIRRAVPELRIVPEDLAQAVQQRMAATVRKGEAIRDALSKPGARSGADGKYMLTGLLRCGTCGGPISSTGRGIFGCSVRHNRGTFACSNDVKFSRVLAEREIVAAVQSQLFTPAAVDTLIALIRDEYGAQSGTGEQARMGLRKTLLEAEKAIAGCVKFIEAGNVSRHVAARLVELEAMAEAARAQLECAKSEPTLSTADIESVRAAAIAARDVVQDLLAQSPAEARAALGQLLGESLVKPAADKKTVEIILTGQVPGLLSVGANQRRGDTSAQEKTGSADVDLRFLWPRNQASRDRIHGTSDVCSSHV